jgi:dTMP kinase
MIRPNAPGWLIVLEGIDGAGKSTIVRRISEYCESIGKTWVASAEPTRGPWGMKLRKSMTEGRLTLEDELELFLKDRAEHVEGVILPNLRQGKVVILDRYYISTAAYQGARGVSPEWVLTENERFAPKPDIVLLLDFDPAAGLERIAARGDKPNSFEQLDQLREVRKIFLDIRRPFIRCVEAAAPPEAVWEACRLHIEKILVSDNVPL